VLALDRGVHVRDGEALGLEAHRVVPHPHVAVAEALELDLADAGDRLDLGADHVADVVGHEGRGAAAPDRDPHDRLVLGVRLLTIGGSIPRGRRRCSCESLAWTSWRAMSMSRSSSNSTVTLALPWREEEEISLTPSTEVTASSTRSTTSVSMISGRPLPGDRGVHDREVHVGVLADPSP